MKRTVVALAAGALCAAVTVAYAAGFFTNGLPEAGGSQYPETAPLTGLETFPADTNLTGGLNPASEAITANMLAGFVGGVTDGWRNSLIGGDFGTNLWQRGTTSAAITTVLLYGADRWWGLSGTGTEVKIIKQTGAADITAGFSASARLQRTAAQTGVVASCMGQVLSSANSYQYQGKQVEFSFWALAGATFSAANSVVTVTIATGTGVDGTAANFSTGSWTGYAAATAQATTISTTWTRYSAVATIPATAAQVGVKICFTPVGTAGATDFFEIIGAQLTINPGAVANDGDGTTDGAMMGFEHRAAMVEELLQKAYYWKYTEVAGGYIAPGMVTATNVENGILQFPAPMRSTPTCTFTAGGFKWDLNGTDTAVTTLTQVTGTTNEFLTIGDTTTATVGWTAFLFGSSTTGLISCTAEL